jgi:hypothetical protein
MKDQFILERLNGIKKQVNAIEKHISKPEPEPKSELAWWSGNLCVGQQQRPITPEIVTIKKQAKQGKYTITSESGFNGWNIPASELRFVGDEVYWDGIAFSGVKRHEPCVAKITTIVDYINLTDDNIVYWSTTPEHLSTTPIELKERPEPKFARGDMTDKGIINSIIRYDDEHGWLYERPDYIRFWEYELTAVPKSCPIITLFKVVDCEVKTEIKKWLGNFLDNNPFYKNLYAKNAFCDGYCAVLIEQDGKAEWKPCPEIADVYNFIKEWHSFTAIIPKIKTVIEQAINHDKWTVESNGVKMRAYRMKDGEVHVSFTDGVREYAPESPVLTALSFTPANIMPYILHGKG